MTEVVNMQRSTFNYLIGNLTEDAREHIARDLGCGCSIDDLAHAIVSTAEGLEAISETTLVSHDIFWISLIEVMHPSFYDCAKAVALPCPNKSYLRSTSAWRDLHGELRILLGDDDALKTLEEVLSSSGEAELDHLANYELVLHSLCQHELSSVNNQAQAYGKSGCNGDCGLWCCSGDPEMSDLLSTSVVSWCIRSASPVCMGLKLTKAQKWELFVSSTKLGRTPIVGALSHDKEIKSMLGTSNCKALFDAVAHSPNEEAMKVALGIIPSDGKDLTEMLCLLIMLSGDRTRIYSTIDGRDDIPIARFMEQLRKIIEYKETNLDSLAHPIATISAIVKDGRANISTYEDSVLIWAVRGAHVDLVSLILADPDFVPSQGSGEALVHATVLGHEEVTRLLLSRGRIQGAYSVYLGIAVLAAALYNHLPIVKLFLSTGTVHPYVMLSVCCSWGSEEILHDIIADIRGGRIDVAPHELWMHSLFIWYTEPHPLCAKRVISELSLDLRKDGNILARVMAGFMSAKVNESNSEAGVKCLLEEMSLSPGGGLTRAEYDRALSFACKSGLNDILEVLLEYGTTEGLTIPESVLNSCLERAISCDDAWATDCFLGAATPTPKAHGRYLSSTLSCEGLFNSNLLRALLRHHNAGALPEAMMLCVNAVGMNDTNAVSAFISCKSFPTGAENSLVLRMALSRIATSPKILGLILADSTAADGMDDGGIESLLDCIFRSGYNELLELAIIQDGVKGERLKSETLQRMAKELNWHNTGETSTHGPLLLTSFQEEKERLRVKLLGRL